MAETPDFEQIAQRLANEVGYVQSVAEDGSFASTIKRALLDGWNARGAADRALLEQSLSTQMGSTAAGPYVQNLTREIKALDR